MQLSAAGVLAKLGADLAFELLIVDLNQANENVHTIATLSLIPLAIKG